LRRCLCWLRQLLLERSDGHRPDEVCRQREVHDRRGGAALLDTIRAHDGISGINLRSSPFPLGSLPPIPISPTRQKRAGLHIGKVADSLYLSSSPHSFLSKKEIFRRLVPNKSTSKFHNDPRSDGRNIISRREHVAVDGRVRGDRGGRFGGLSEGSQGGWESRELGVRWRRCPGRCTGCTLSALGCTGCTGCTGRRPALSRAQETKGLWGTGKEERVTQRVLSEDSLSR
jgi:hypothetical protein